jgi:hypothetical protein
MIGWLNPGALWALPLAAAPVVIHLLRAHVAARVAFPSLRFVQPSRTAAVRMRLPSDVLLMLVRTAIVALAVGALARPIVLTSGRTSVWNARTARAVVVDISDSMRVSDAGGVAPASIAADLAAAELGTAAYGWRIDARDLNEGLTRAGRLLGASPPARREVVVISDMQRGALRAPGSVSLPDGVGLRFVAVGRPVEHATFDGTRLLGAGTVGARDQSIVATAETTAVEIAPRRVNDERGGLRLVAAPGSEASLARLLSTVAIAGAPEPSAQQPIAILFAGGSSPLPALAPIRPGWMLRTALRLRDDPALFTSPSSTIVERDPPASWTILARKADGVPLVSAAASGHELLLDVAASPDSLVAATVVRAVLMARLDADIYAEREVARIADHTIALLTRQPGPVTRDAWRTTDATDARWLWLVGLGLLGMEQWLRDRSARHRDREAHRAAA